MMRQANREFGFEADNIPLMIEAIPVNADSIILIITKVEDPEELDTRFSKFAPSREQESASVQFDGADSIIDIFQKIYEAKMRGATQKPNAQIAKEKQESAEGEPTVNLVRLYNFENLDDVISASHGLHNFYTGVNSLYKDVHSQDYLLVIHQSSYTPEEFNKVCNILSEYGDGKAFSHAGEAHLLEHGDVIIPTKALQELSQL